MIKYTSLPYRVCRGPIVGLDIRSGLDWIDRKTGIDGAGLEEYGEPGQGGGRSVLGSRTTGGRWRARAGRRVERAGKERRTTGGRWRARAGRRVERAGKGKRGPGPADQPIMVASA